MQLKKYGIVLKSLKPDDLDLTRKWRNSDHVRLNMAYQKKISLKEQQLWFDQLDKLTNFYFVITYNNKKVGVVNIKNVDKQEAEAGIFIGEQKYLNTHVPILATVLIMEFAFETLKLKTLYAKIDSKNIRAILFNEGIGYTKAKKPTTKGFEYYYTTPLLFKAATKTIRETLDKLN